MKPEKQFQLNLSLPIITTLLSLLGIIPFTLISYPQNLSNQELIITTFYIAVFITPAIMLSWITFQQKNLRYTETEISQPKLFGEITIRGDEITEVKFGSSIQICSVNKRVSISTLAHKEPKKIKEFINSKIEQLKK